MLNTVNLFIALVVAAITYGTPLLFGTLGEVLTEKSGSLNLGVEGIMFMGGAIGLGGVFYYEKAVESPSAFLAVLIGLLGAFIGGGISAVGGMVYITTIAGCVWNHEGLSGVGWLAVALVIFCLWRPLSAIWGSVLFGALMILYLRLTIPFIPTQLYKILPYVVTLVVLIIVSLRKKREDQPPTSLGLNYFREDR